jgi:hypothetical protein
VRGCAAVLVLAAAFALGAAWFGAPALASAVVGIGLNGAGFEARSTSVSVEADPPLAILAGHADRIVIGADGGRLGDLEATRIDLVLLDVDLATREFTEVRGTLTGTRVVRDDGSRMAIGRVELRGPGTAARAVVTTPGPEVERMAAAALNDALGLPVVGARLSAPDTLRVEIAGQGVDTRLVVEPDGALAIAVPLPGQPRVVLMDPAPLVLESVTVADGNLVLTGSVDLVRAMAGERP